LVLLTLRDNRRSLGRNCILLLAVLPGQDAPE
jgi:hypothetical protein